MRVYNCRLKMSENSFDENEAKSVLKRSYAEYLEPVRLLTEPQLIKALQKGMVISCEIAGMIEHDPS